MNSFKILVAIAVNVSGLNSVWAQQAPRGPQQPRGQIIEITPAPAPSPSATLHIPRNVPAGRVLTPDKVPAIRVANNCAFDVGKRVISEAMGPQSDRRRIGPSHFDQAIVRANRECLFAPEGTIPTRYAEALISWLREGVLGAFVEDVGQLEQNPTRETSKNGTLWVAVNFAKSIMTNPNLRPTINHLQPNSRSIEGLILGETPLFAVHVFNIVANPPVQGDASVLHHQCTIQVVIRRMNVKNMSDECTLTYSCKKPSEPVIEGRNIRGLCR